MDRGFFITLQAMGVHTSQHKSKPSAWRKPPALR